MPAADTGRMSPACMPAIGQMPTAAPGALRSFTKVLIFAALTPLLMRIGSACVSTNDHDLTRHRTVLQVAGCERIFEGKAAARSAR